MSALNGERLKLEQGHWMAICWSMILPFLWMSTRISILPWTAQQTWQPRAMPIQPLQTMRKLP